MTVRTLRTHISLALLFAGLAFPLTSSAQVAARGDVTASASAPRGMAQVPAAMVGAVSSQNARVGQALLAKVTQPAKLADGTTLPSGSQLMGRVTEAKSAAGSQGMSRLGMLFDQAKTPDGQVKKIKSLVQGIGPSGTVSSGGQASASAEGSDASVSGHQRESAGQPGGSLLDGVGSTLGGVTNTAGSVVNSAGGAAGTLTGLPGVLLSQTGGASGLLTAQGKNIDLASGTSVTFAVSSK